MDLVGMVNGRRVEDFQLLVNVDDPFCAKHFITVIHGIGLGKDEVLILCYSTEPHIYRNITTIGLGGFATSSMRMVGVNWSGYRRLLSSEYIIISPGIL